MSWPSKGRVLLLAVLAVLVLSLPALAVETDEQEEPPQVAALPDYPVDGDSGVLLVQVQTPEGDADLSYIASAVLTVGGVLTGILLGSEVSRRWTL